MVWPNVVVSTPNLCNEKTVSHAQAQTLTALSANRRNISDLLCVCMQLTYLTTSLIHTIEMSI